MLSYAELEGISCILGFSYLHDCVQIIMKKKNHFPNLATCWAAAQALQKLMLSSQCSDWPSPSVTSQYSQYISVPVSETCSATQGFGSFVPQNLPILLQLCGGQTAFLCQTRQDPPPQTNTITCTHTHIYTSFFLNSSFNWEQWWKMKN